MRILHVDIPIDSVAGREAAKRTLEVSRAMGRAGITNDILTDSRSMSEYVDKLKSTQISVFIFSTDGSASPGSKRKQLTRIIAPYDLVHISNHWTYVNALVYHACKKQQKPYVICPAGDTVLSVSTGLLKRLFNALVGINPIRQAAAHVAISPAEIFWFKEYGVNEKKVTVIPNGIHPGEFTALPDRAFKKRLGPGATPYILFAGRLDKKNAPDLLLKAYVAEAGRELEQYHLVFAGPQGDFDHKRQMAACGAEFHEKIHFPGFLGREETAKAYHGAELLVVPCRWTSMPVTAIEAGICATPVLLTEPCGFDDLEAAGGAMVVPTSEEGLRNGLRALCRDRQGLQSMGNKLRKHILSHYTWDAVAQQYLRLYQRILQPARPN
jgi:glycosyltransferase involved in cell wall biosynthesis